jgi:hypothetical protein
MKEYYNSLKSSQPATNLWGRMESCAAVGNRRRPINNRPQLTKLPYKGCV